MCYHPFENQRRVNFLLTEKVNQKRKKVLLKIRYLKESIHIISDFCSTPNFRVFSFKTYLVFIYSKIDIYICTSREITQHDYRKYQYWVKN